MSITKTEPLPAPTKRRARSGAIASPFGLPLSPIVVRNLARGAETSKTSTPWLVQVPSPLRGERVGERGVSRLYRFPSPLQGRGLGRGALAGRPVIRQAFDLGHHPVQDSQAGVPEVRVGDVHAQPPHQLVG